jgi:hypothetical protein
MGTRSTIALEFADGTVQQVYCHWDGYLDHNGRILQDHYSDPFKLRELIDLGDLSSLGPNIGFEHPFSPHASKEDEALYEAAKEAGACTFYARDRGETGVKAKKFKDFEDYKKNHQYEEYEYILRACGDKAVWFVADYNDTYVPLLDAMAKETAEETEDAE